MTFDQDIHHRRSIRLRDYNYTHAGAYFVTICTFERECLLGEVMDGVVLLAEMGQMAQKCWDNIPNHFPHVELDAFVIMPNHVHGIIFLTDNVQRVGAQHAASLHSRNVVPGSLCAIIRSFKSAVTKGCNASNQGAACCAPTGTVWQRNYYERIIRDERELFHVRQYIADNPTKWGDDENHPDR